MRRRVRRAERDIVWIDGGGTVCDKIDTLRFRNETLNGADAHGETVFKDWCRFPLFVVVSCAKERKWSLGLMKSGQLASGRATS